MVARESYLLKTLYPLVNAQAEVESIIDGGSQIISMSADVAIQVGATWDPDVTIQMQSANKQLEKTQGLVRICHLDLATNYCLFSSTCDAECGV